MRCKSVVDVGFLAEAYNNNRKKKERYKRRFIPQMGGEMI
jgi:hypothetical protein